MNKNIDQGSILDERMGQVDTLKYRNCTVPVWKVLDPACKFYHGEFIRFKDLPADMAQAFKKWQFLAACPGQETSYLRDFIDFMDLGGRGWSGDFSEVVKKYR